MSLREPYDIQELCKEIMYHPLTCNFPQGIKMFVFEMGLTDGGVLHKSSDVKLLHGIWRYLYLDGPIPVELAPANSLQHFFDGLDGVTVINKW